ncbi:ATP-binding protein [Actinoallomurus sp. NPDC052274]|uniref:ATP-binding protein n=1 Tax=Actinoallomurus sp. NPDC052274 TaxID=3155420 RepID=UPI0034451E7C
MTLDPTVIPDHADPPIAASRPSWLALRARPEYASKARAFASTAVFGYPFDAYEIALIVSALVTNAIRAAMALRTWPDDSYPIGVELLATTRYVHLAVTDPDHRPMPAPDQGGLLAEHGRGLTIVDQHAADRWVTYAKHGKTVHVVIPAEGVTLTAAELTARHAPA